MPRPAGCNAARHANARARPLRHRRLGDWPRRRAARRVGARRRGGGRPRARGARPRDSRWSTPRRATGAARRGLASRCTGGATAWWCRRSSATACPASRTGRGRASPAASSSRSRACARRGSTSPTSTAARSRCSRAATSSRRSRPRSAPARCAWRRTRATARRSRGRSTAGCSARCSARSTSPTSARSTRRWRARTPAGLGVLAKRTLANAAWREAAPPATPDRAEYWHRLRAMELPPPGAPAAEHAIRFVLAQPGVSSALVGTTSLANLTAAIAAAGSGPLDTASVAHARAAFQRCDRGWDGVISAGACRARGSPRVARDQSRTSRDSARTRPFARR